ncbi:MAG: hypothetical protein IKP00_12015 [Victivallales bacterium]|nr:hypothetical protein [Victivallales bacterium]
MADEATPKILAVEFNLGTYKVYDADQGKDVDTTLKGNVYTVSGLNDSNGHPLQLSMSGLVMVICLAQAAAREADVIRLMTDLSNKTDELETLTEIEQNIVNDFASSSHSDPYALESHTISSGKYAGMTYRTFLVNQGVIDSRARWVYRSSLPNPGQDILYDDLVSSLESKLDAGNSFSQQKMIELQSATNKRDLAYNMITNMLKSLNTVQQGIANNM